MSRVGRRVWILACCRTDAGNLSIIEMNGEYRVLWNCHLPTELSRSGMQRLGSRCMTTPKKTVQRPPHCSPTLNDDFISFSSISTHALRNTTELLTGTLHDDRMSTFTFLGQDGWWYPIVGSHSGYHPLLKKAFYNRCTAL
ncbi:hypothetical protein CY34DRAFT_814000, partial [Suillus luteus UH-Slu-Lm8-n1]